MWRALGCVRGRGVVGIMDVSRTQEHQHVTWEAGGCYGSIDLGLAHKAWHKRWKARGFNVLPSPSERKSVPHRSGLVHDTFLHMHGTTKNVACTGDYGIAP
jgi:hypothetical protein